jgi:hypothetical protein
MHDMYARVSPVKVGGKLQEVVEEGFNPIKVILGPSQPQRPCLSQDVSIHFYLAATFTVLWPYSDAYTFLPATMSNPSKDTVQGKPKLVFNKFTARLSPAPSPSLPDPQRARCFGSMGVVEYER